MSHKKRQCDFLAHLLHLSLLLEVNENIGIMWVSANESLCYNVFEFYSWLYCNFVSIFCPHNKYEI